LRDRENILLEGLITGDENTYHQLFNEYYRKLTLFAIKYVIELEEAKEIVQDLFVHLFEIRESLIITSSLESYLYRSVKNRCLNHIQQKKMHNKHMENIYSTMDSSIDMEEKIRASELEYRISEIISDLPDQCKNIYTMSRVDGKKNLEISKELNISIRTVETQISKALKLLRSKLRDYLKY
jgi:RNA polymerase sigma-70 factor (family 1)